MKKGALFPACALCLCLLFPAGCGRPERAEEKRTGTVFAMDTVMDLTIYGEEELFHEAEEKILGLEKLFSATDENSEVYRLNQGEDQQVSWETMDILSQALELCRRTDGALDISIYPLVRAWGFTTGEYRVPSEGELQELRGHVGYDRIRLRPKERTVLLPEGMEVDLGGVAKGYTGDALISLFRERGVSSALCNLGGNVQALGRKPDGSRWRIAIKNPFGEGTVGVLKVDGQAVVTSGGYERYFERDGKVYWHILDPVTGRPAEKGLVSVTIVSDSGLLCDGLSTALFVMGEEKAIDFWRDSQDFEMILVGEDRHMAVTEGLEEFFTLSQDSPISKEDYQVIARDPDEG